jgi:hypothetical protein
VTRNRRRPRNRPLRTLARRARRSRRLLRGRSVGHRRRWGRRSLRLRRLDSHNRGRSRSYCPERARSDIRRARHRRHRWGSALLRAGRTRRGSRPRSEPAAVHRSTADGSHPRLACTQRSRRTGESQQRRARAWVVGTSRYSRWAREHRPAELLGKRSPGRGGAKKCVPKRVHTRAAVLSAGPGSGQSPHGTPWSTESNAGISSRSEKPKGFSENWHAFKRSARCCVASRSLSRALQGGAAMLLGDGESAGNTHRCCAPDEPRSSRGTTQRGRIFPSRPRVARRLCIVGNGLARAGRPLPPGVITDSALPSGTPGPRVWSCRLIPARCTARGSARGSASVYPGGAVTVPSAARAPVRSPRMRSSCASVRHRRRRALPCSKVALRSAERACVLHGLIGGTCTMRMACTMSEGARGPIFAAGGARLRPSHAIGANSEAWVTSHETPSAPFRARSQGSGTVLRYCSASSARPPARNLH